jgi:hypothetical protein
MPIRAPNSRHPSENRLYARGGIVREDSRRQCGGIAGNCRPKCNRKRRTCHRLGSISQDPIGFAAGDVNQYRYVGNGPTNGTDPSGLEEKQKTPPADAPNQAMIGRLRAGKTSSHDINFYVHELKESALMARGVQSRPAHRETLEWQGILYRPGYENQLYHPSVICRFRENFNEAAWPK